MYTIESLREALAGAEVSPGGADGRIFPSSFDPHVEAPPFYRPLSWRWQSAEEAIRRLGAKGVMMRLALFLQLEAPLARAAHAAGAYIFVNDAGNMPLGAAALLQAEIGCIVTTGGDGGAFGEYLTGRNLAARGWLLVRDMEEDSWDAPHSIAKSEVPITQEVHLFPGLPAFVQCEHLATDRRPRFHAAEDVAVGEADGSLTITCTDVGPFPFSDIVLPYVRDDGVCHCGKPVFARE